MKVSISAMAFAVAAAVMLHPSYGRAHGEHGFVPNETPEEWVELGGRVHGGFGSFIPLGIRIGLDAAQKLKVDRRQIAVFYFDNDKAPCACFADGVALATVSSVGQRTLTIMAEKAPSDAAAVIVIRPRAGGAGFKYTIPFTSLPVLQKMNSDLQPLERFHAVMRQDNLFKVEAIGP